MICASGSVGGARPCQGRGRGFESRLALSLSQRRHPFGCLLCDKRVLPDSYVRVSPLRSVHSRRPPDVVHRLALPCLTSFSRNKSCRTRTLPFFRSAPVCALSRASFPTFFFLKLVLPDSYVRVSPLRSVHRLALPFLASFSRNKSCRTRTLPFLRSAPVCALSRTSLPTFFYYK